MSKLKAMRLKTNISVKELAIYLNCTERAIYNYENNKRNLKSNMLKKLANLYKCNIEELID